MSSTSNPATFEWRGEFANPEVNELHAEAFDTRVFAEWEWNWSELTARHSLGWVIARHDSKLVGFVNVVWDGLVHAWIQDLMVSAPTRSQGIGVGLVRGARDGAAGAGCEWLHVDFDDHMREFYLGACGFRATNGGLMPLGGKA